ncbi:hypothetical protein [Myroides fluvii]|uniref:hypothetical protein n=1 Tax=Myroides fluvii TaxID=2572594 RepID=UPI00131E62E7|nr:hypothetical protein [Myroides fluvii]
MYLDVNDNLIFQRNTVKQVFEYAIEVLENIGEPSKLIEIYDLLEKNNPGITKSHDALRGSLQRTTEIIYFGRSSTYGLKKWESERNNIKGGTIKDIVTEYLKKNNEPIHIYEILEEIHKFRADTNAKNVITNLKLDPQKQFVIFNQSFIGLNNNSYHSNLVDLPKFLGKAITKHIRKNHSIDIDTLNHYYCGLLNITNKNMNYIIQQLIDNKFININEKKN